MFERFMNSQSLASPSDSPRNFPALRQRERSLRQGDMLRNVLRKNGQK